MRPNFGDMSVFCFFFVFKRYPNLLSQKAAASHRPAMFFLTCMLVLIPSTCVCGHHQTVPCFVGATFSFWLIELVPSENDITKCIKHKNVGWDIYMHFLKSVQTDCKPGIIQVNENKMFD
jgi:hypothetical protein